jgi:hypothetical protein
MMRMPESQPDGAAEQEMADRALQYAAEAAAHADARWRALVEEKKGILDARVARQSQPPTGEVVKMTLSGSSKRGK